VAVDPPWRLDPLQNIVNVGWVSHSWDISVGMFELAQVSKTITGTVNCGIGTVFSGTSIIPGEVFEFGKRRQSQVEFAGGVPGGEGGTVYTAYKAGGSAVIKLAKFDDPVTIITHVTGINSGGFVTDISYGNTRLGAIFDISFPSAIGAVTFSETISRSGHVLAFSVAPG
jgi:hypothetical protein